MTLTFDKTTARIRTAISEIEDHYQRTKGLILNESDLKCILYSKLFQYFGEEIETLDQNIKSIPLHTEVSFFNENHYCPIKIQNLKFTNLID